MCIEVNGDYWHSLPQRRQRDAKKYKIAVQAGYKVCYVWEHEVKSNPELIKYRIKHLFHKPSFDFLNCELRVISSQQAEEFLLSYHYQGSGRSGTTTIGAFNNGNLIAVCVFTSISRMEMAEKQSLSYDVIRELSRFCIHPSYQTKNFATWFLAKSRKLLCKNEPKIKLLISFADPNFGHNGTIYKADNWIYDGETSPSYWYVNSKFIIVHKKTVWNKAKSISKTESDYASENNLIKVTARPKLRYIKKI